MLSVFFSFVLVYWAEISKSHTVCFAKYKICFFVCNPFPVHVWTEWATWICIYQIWPNNNFIHEKNFHCRFKTTTMTNNKDTMIFYLSFQETEILIFFNYKCTSTWKYVFHVTPVSTSIKLYKYCFQTSNCIIEALFLNQLKGNL